MLAMVKQWMTLLLTTDCRDPRSKQPEKSSLDQKRRKWMLLRLRRICQVLPIWLQE
jgi:hypothetical protein